MEKKLIEEFYQYADAGRGTVQKYMGAMEKKHGMKAMWSLDLDTELRNRYRIMAWCLLYREKNRAPKEVDVLKKMADLEEFQIMTDKIEEEKALLEDRRWKLRREFMETVGYKFDGESVGRIMIGCMLKD